MNYWLRKKLGRKHSIGKLMGTGGFANVYELNSNTEKLVLKVIRLNDTNYNYHLSQTQLEVKIMNEFRFYNHFSQIVNSFEEVRHGKVEKVYIVMKRYKSLHANSMVTENKLIRIALDVSHALKNLHAHSYLHRDVKPQNIFVDDNGNYLLGDFGAAKDLKATILDDFDPVATIIGSFSYIAPEILNETPLVGYNSDIYSLGITMYHLLTNSFPNRDSEVNIAGVSEELCQIISRAIKYDPNERYATIEDMIKDLHKLKTVPIRNVEFLKNIPDEQEIKIPLFLKKQHSTPEAAATTFLPMEETSSLEETLPKQVQAAENSNDFFFEQFISKLIVGAIVSFLIGNYLFFHRWLIILPVYDKQFLNIGYTLFYIIVHTIWFGCTYLLLWIGSSASLHKLICSFTTLLKKKTLSSNKNLPNCCECITQDFSYILTIVVATIYNFLLHNMSFLYN